MFSGADKCKVPTKSSVILEARNREFVRVNNYSEQKTPSSLDEI